MSMQIFGRIDSKAQFDRYLNAGIPAVIEGVVEGWKAYKLWYLDYLTDVFKDRERFELGGFKFTFAQFADELE